MCGGDVSNNAERSEGIDSKFFFFTMSSKFKEYLKSIFSFWLDTCYICVGQLKKREGFNTNFWTFIKRRLRH